LRGEGFKKAYFNMMFCLALGEKNLERSLFGFFGNISVCEEVLID